ncbi:MAG TPA: hypothetical protein VG755_41045, partial [Nannocystaceae bacterium]|nr:hypothetical protein [Nannocystaceae bacterium]
MTSPKSGGGDDGGEKPGISIVEGPAASNQEGPDDLRYAEVLPGEVRLEPPDEYVEWEDHVGRFTPGQITVEGELAH